MGIVRTDEFDFTDVGVGGRGRFSLLLSPLVNGDVVPKEVPSWCQAAKQELPSQPPPAALYHS